MLHTFIKNRGSTKTLIHDNNRNSVNEINWDADYDGEVANVSLDLQKNGQQKHYEVTLDNEDLANILNIPSINQPLERRLKRDFNRRSYKNSHNLYKIEFDNLRSPHVIPTVPQNKNEQTIEELLETLRQPSPPHISSPLPNEEFIIPLSAQNNQVVKYTLAPKKRTAKKRKHKIYKLHKTIKSNKKTSKSKKRGSTITFPFI